MKPRRSILSVPGHIEKMHHKAAASAADVIMLDLEDSVPAQEKDRARAAVIQALHTIDWKTKTVTVRVNEVDGPFCYRDLTAVVEAAGDRIDTIVVPKVNDPGDLLFISRLLDGITLHKGWQNNIGIEAIIETASGMDRIGEIARCSDRLRTLVFGIADYSASVGARLDSISGHGEESDVYPGHRWHYPMSRIVMAAKANGLKAIDTPYGKFKDPDGLRKSTAQSLAIGYDGKWAIHPDQLEVINEVMTPNRADIDRALKVIDAYEQARAAGRGAASVDGSMIDHATMRLAEELAEQARFLGLL